MDFHLCQPQILEIAAVTSGLIGIMENAVVRETTIHSSFFNIARAGSVTNHTRTIRGTIFIWATEAWLSLAYYLDVGDQSCKDPGAPKLLGPDFEYLACNNDIVIMHGTRRFFATCSGKTDRIMIGINFYAVDRRYNSSG